MCIVIYFVLYCYTRVSKHILPDGEFHRSLVYVLMLKKTIENCVDINRLSYYNCIIKNKLSFIIEKQNS